MKRIVTIKEPAGPQSLYTLLRTLGLSPHDFVGAFPGTALIDEDAIRVRLKDSDFNDETIRYILTVAFQICDQQADLAHKYLYTFNHRDDPNSKWVDIDAAASRAIEEAREAARTAEWRARHDHAHGKPRTYDYESTAGTASGFHLGGEAETSFVSGEQRRAERLTKRLNEATSDDETMAIINEFNEAEKTHHD